MSLISGNVFRSMIVRGEQLKGSFHSADKRVQMFSYLLSPEVNDNLFKLLIFGFICLAQLL